MGTEVLDNVHLTKSQNYLFCGPLVRQRNSLFLGLERLEIELMSALQIQVAMLNGTESGPTLSVLHLNESRMSTSDLNLYHK